MEGHFRELDPSLFRILCCYGSLSPSIKTSLELPRAPTLSFEVVHGFFLALLDDHHFHAYPPSHEFQRTWWKWTLSRLEALLHSDAADPENDEIDSRIYEHYTSLLEASSQSGSRIFASNIPQPSYLTYWVPADFNADHEIRGRVDVSSMLRITMRESRTTIESGTTGLRTWQASLVLADFLVAHPGLIQGQKVLELGAGAGFLGAVVASIQTRSPSGASHGSLHLTDVNAQVLERCQENIRLPCNAVDHLESVHVHELDWFDALPSGNGADQTASTVVSVLEKVNPEVILGADIVYDPSIIPALIATLDLALSHSGGSPDPKHAYIALTVRNEATISRFFEAARTMFQVDELPWTLHSFLDRQLGEKTPSPVQLVKLSK